jgi:hypothetical protein
MEHTDTLRGQNTDLFNVKAGGVYSNHWTLKGLGSAILPRSTCSESSNQHTSNEGRASQQGIENGVLVVVMY